ncbi:HAMP domain-containing sensor histidine kinase [Hymenobacter sp. H14-R3]|uniref:sensor histidine kinase n=1 Tax=Hymenobacter sp. H14-R3 TaxID=3046308 RepID=UPI0024BB7B3D|nr:HAMP domain-containing sensor histidine kinase [Hymenobacter sp. H14-R3]MDJ0365367.1 HAMP domain-containing sensor histidine kinase [Hymenobacter sp. H14-R3]
MSIRLRLAAQFGAILVITLVLFALAIYFVTQRARHEEFTQSLFKRAMVVGHAYADGQARPDADHQASYRQYLRQLYRTLPAEEGRVYNAAGQLVFREGQRPPTTTLPAAWLAEVRRQGRAVLEPEANYHETVGLLYHDARLGPLVVVAASVDEDGRRQLHGLRQVLAGGLLAAGLVMSVGAWLLAGQALRPLRRMVSEVDGITATDLSHRLTQAQGQADELGHLGQRFNRLLDRLESAFVGQRTFVRDASHELRTPLTALIGELEVALLPAERPTADYRRTLQSTLDAARQLSSLTNGLLQIARASGDASQVTMAPVRVDELLLQAHEQILRRYPTCRVDLELGDESMPDVRGNEALLLAAILNVLDNACKYSAGATAPVLATLLPLAGRLRLLVQDYGAGLSPADLEQVFVPFFRAASVRGLPGHGIGLPLTAQIMALHGGVVRVASEPGQGTQVRLEWPTITGA